MNQHVAAIVSRRGEDRPRLRRRAGWSSRAGLWPGAGCWLLLWGILISAPSVLAQPKAEIRRPAQLDPVQAQKEGQALVADVLAQKPAADATNTGTILIHRPGAPTLSVPVTFGVTITSTNWLNTYAAAAAGTLPAARLTVLHAEQQPNQYRLETGPGTPTETVLAGDQAAIPFAGSDFWVCDLGLEFFHWPKQALLRKELKRGQSCSVLESSHPHPGSGAYARVVTWLDNDSGGIIFAEAFDAQDRKIKEFEPKGFKKVHGQWQLEGMQIRNLATGSRTRIEFHLDEAK